MPWFTTSSTNGGIFYFLSSIPTIIAYDSSQLYQTGYCLFLEYPFLYVLGIVRGPFQTNGALYVSFHLGLSSLGL